MILTCERDDTIWVHRCSKVNDTKKITDRKRYTSGVTKVTNEVEKMKWSSETVILNERSEIMITQYTKTYITKSIILFEGCEKFDERERKEHESGETQEAISRNNGEYEN